MATLGDMFMMIAQNGKGAANPFQTGLTHLEPMEEQAFKGWVNTQNIPFQPEDPMPDYDMRGFFRDMLAGKPTATTGADMTDGGRMHFGDYYKMPWHPTFSNESRGANFLAPQWEQRGQYAPEGGSQEDDWVLQGPLGNILYDWR